jgi:hypothetical protein
MDNESRLEVVYRILKEELRRAKKELLGIKKHKDIKNREAREIKRKIFEANMKNKEEGKVIQLYNMDGEYVASKNQPKTTV